MAQFSIFREQIGQIIGDGTKSTLARKCLEDNNYNAEWTNVCYSKTGGGEWTGSNFSDVSENNYQNSLDNMATTYGTGNHIYFGNIWGNILVSAYNTNTGPHADFNLQDISDVQLSFANIANDQLASNATLSQYRANKKKRTELDLKMQELYEFGENDRQIMFDNSVYTTLAWTVLATSVLYYLFVKL